MAILDLQKRVAEIGRIRIGASQTRTRDGHTFKVPVKLDRFRLTSRDRDALEVAASLYGGAVRPWDESDGAFELLTETDELPVVLMPGAALSQWWELWGQAGKDQAVRCLRRCDGITETLSDKPCLCPAYDERRELAAKGKACRPTTRLSVILRDVPRVGYWRLESHGFYAAVELAGAAELLEEATRRGALLPARLRIEPRKGVGPDGKTRTWLVPALDVAVRFDELAAIGRGEHVAGELAGGRPAVAGELEAGPEGGYTPAPARGEVTAAEALEATRRQAAPATRTARSAEPIAATGRSSRKAPEPPADEVPGGSGDTPAAELEQAPPPEAAPPADEPNPQPEPETPPAADEPDEAPRPERSGARATEAQRKLIRARASKAGVSEERLDELISQATDGATTSTTELLKPEVDVVLTAIAAEPGA